MRPNTVHKAYEKLILKYLRWFGPATKRTAISAIPCIPEHKDLDIDSKLAIAKDEWERLKQAGKIRRLSHCSIEYEAAL